MAARESGHFFIGHHALRSAHQTKIQSLIAFAEIARYGTAVEKLGGNIVATHRVLLTTPPLEVGKADVRLDIRKNDEKLGELRVSHGSAVWFPNGNMYGYKLSWTKIDELFIEHGQKKAELR